MTALPLEPHTEAEEAALKRIEAAEPAEESAVEKVARALCNGDAEDHDTYMWDEANDELRDDYRRAACHAIGAMKGGSRAEEALARVEAVCTELDAAWLICESDEGRRIADRIRAAIAAPVAQAGEGR